ncbi:flagellin lysine-N-methylase [Dendrosporobacter sp. 1207_IL3150]|uniref:flagellin lysine-N-methylase n=1 Tax=Dendrosporobacter sp. 1207_IL3150 TaxID=3084054 RepID=UPI002FD92B0C
MYIYLDLVENFECKMCGTCCRRNWLVTIDERSYQRNWELFKRQGRQLEFKKAFAINSDRSLPEEFACITKKTSGECWFLTDANLCTLHSMAGHSHLDAVCQTFPRYPINSSRGIELTLSMSCPSVLEQLNREEPLKLIKNNRPPLSFLPETYVEQVFPKQKRTSDILHYYFEVEQHFIDIIQCRNMMLKERIDLLEKTIEKLESISMSSDIGMQLNKLINRNYDLMEDENGKNEVQNHAVDFMMEHFMVNYIFKKPFYSYGLKTAFNWLKYFHHTFNQAISGAADGDQLDYAKKVIMDLEVEYGHNRSALKNGFCDI